MSKKADPYALTAAESAAVLDKEVHVLRGALALAERATLDAAGAAKRERIDAQMAPILARMSAAKAKIAAAEEELLAAENEAAQIVGRSCPKCDGRGGRYCGYGSEGDWKSCDRCDGGWILPKEAKAG